jgi:hypothetical protein
MVSALFCLLPEGHGNSKFRAETKKFKLRTLGQPLNRGISEICENQALLHWCRETVFVTIFRTSVIIFGLIASRSRIWMGKLNTHCRMGLIGKTSSTRWIALSDMRRPPQLGQNPRFLHGTHWYARGCRLCIGKFCNARGYRL